MLAEDYIAQVCKINSCLMAFPTKPGREAIKIPTDNLLDLLEYRFSLKWQKTMHLQGFEPQEGSIKDFATLCKHLESSLEDKESKPHKKQALPATKTTRKERQQSFQQ